MNPITPNTFLVSAIAWVVGMVMKKIPKIPNDMIPQLTYYISVGSTYALAVLAQIPHANAAEAAVPVPPPPGPDEVMVGGSMSWILTTAWDWLGRKVVWSKIIKPLARKIAG